VKIEDFRTEPLENPRYIVPALARYSQDGVKRDWEIVKAHDSVAILLYHTGRKAFVLVKQFRPAVYPKDGSGMTVELCAGLVDKPFSLTQIAKEEIVEECGYDVPEEQIEKVTSFYTSVGFAGAKQTLFYAEVDERMRVNEGGGIEGESIELVYLPVGEAKPFLFDESVPKTPGLMFAFMWWFDRFGQ